MSTVYAKQADLQTLLQYLGPNAQRAVHAGLVVKPLAEDLRERQGPLPTTWRAARPRWPCPTAAACGCVRARRLRLVRMLELLHEKLECALHREKLLKAVRARGLVQLLRWHRVRVRLLRELVVALLDVAAGATGGQPKYIVRGGSR